MPTKESTEAGATPSPVRTDVIQFHERSGGKGMALLMDWKGELLRLQVVQMPRGPA